MATLATSIAGITANNQKRLLMMNSPKGWSSDWFHAPVRAQVANNA